MGRLLRAYIVLTSLFVLGASAEAQQARLDRVDSLLRETARDTTEWWRLNGERLEAWMNVDVERAVAFASELAAAAETSVVPGVKSLAASMLGWSKTRFEGPVAAHPLEALAVEPGPDVDRALRIHWYLMRSRWLCLTGEHDQELTFAEHAKTLAQELQDPSLRARAAMAMLFELPRSGIPDLNALFSEIEAAGQSEEVVTLRQWARFHEHIVLKDRGQDEEANRILEELEPLARTSGDQRLASEIAMRWARFAWHENRYREACDAYDRALREFEVLKDRVSRGYVLEVWADAELKAGDLDACQSLIDRNQSLIAGRGFPTLDYGILQTRFELAVAREDGPLAARLSSELEEMQRNQLAAERRKDRVREELIASESEREKTEAELASERERAARYEHRVEAIGALGVILALSIIVLIAVRSRSRLIAANAALEEQIACVELARADQARLEERMRELERSESLGTMAAGVAHDFNNLLTSILGNAELIASAHSREEMASLAEGISRAGQQAARLCKQLQIYSGGVTFVPEEVDLVTIVSETLPVLRAATGGDVALRFEHAMRSAVVMCDRAQIEQVLLNLVVNARDARARNVTIGIRATASSAEGKPEVRIEVADDGEGMPADVARRVFDPFFTTRFPGRGLGLAVVYGVVRRHHGRIEVVSEFGRGSTFAVTLPCASVEAATPAIESAEPADVRVDATVMLVDDDPQVLEVLDRMLRTFGCAPQTFGAGSDLIQALDHVASSRPLLMFVDLEMVGMDGRQVVRAARARRPDARVVIVSGHAQSYVDQIAEQIQPDAVLAKPFDLERMRAALARVLEPSAAVSRAESAGR